MRTTMCFRWIFDLTFLLIGVTDAAVVFVGHTAVARAHYDQEDFYDTMIIDKPYQTIGVDGVLAGWQVYFREDPGSSVRLQVWEPLPDTERIGDFKLVGQTDFQAATHTGLMSFNLPEEKRFHVMSNHVIGFHFEGSNPIPYDYTYTEESGTCYSQISHQFMKKEYSTPIDIGGVVVFGFSGSGATGCRDYAINAEILIDNGEDSLECEEERALQGTDGDVISYSVTDPYESWSSMCWVIEPAGLYVEIFIYLSALQDNCAVGFIEFRRASESGHLEKLWCGSRTSESSEAFTVISPTYIRFRAGNNDIVQSSGFSLRYRRVGIAYGTSPEPHTTSTPSPGAVASSGHRIQPLYPLTAVIVLYLTWLSRHL